MTIKDYKSNSDSDIEIVVKSKEDDCDPMGKILYEGCLGDCPEELDGLTVEAWKSLKAQQAGKVLYYLLHFENAA